jgi:hypothetical protein
MQRYEEARKMPKVLASFLALDKEKPTVITTIGFKTNYLKTNLLKQIKKISLL